MNPHRRVAAVANRASGVGRCHRSTECYLRRVMSKRRGTALVAVVSGSTLTLTLTLAAASLAAAPAASSPRDSSTGGAKAETVDLDLHRVPAGVKDPTPTPAGAVLTPPTSAGTTPYSLRPAPDGGYLYQGVTFNAHILTDGTVDFSSRDLTAARDPEDRGHVSEDHDPVTSTEPVPVGGGPALHFDATNEYLRRLGKDPARDAKAAFLTGTFDLRMKMALESHTDVRRAALAQLPERLNELWRDPRLTASERRYLLRALRDEMGNGPNSAGARAVLRDFARRHLPPKEAAAFR
jgi:hypothetical protein